jgi:hypothetical protein
MCYLGRYAWDRPAPAAPSAHVTLFGVANGPTRWGNVSFGIGPQVAGVVLARIAVDFRVPAGAVVHPPTLQVRIRDPSGSKALESATVAGGATAHCVVAAVDGPQELVTIRPPLDDQATTAIDCTIRATFA